MPNGVGCRAFRTSSHGPVPIQPAMSVSATLTGKRRPAEEAQGSQAGQPEWASSATTRTSQGASRRARATLPYRITKNTAPVTIPRRNTSCPEHGDKDRRELHLTEPQPVGVEAEDLACCAQGGRWRR